MPADSGRGTCGTVAAMGAFVDTATHVSAPALNALTSEVIAAAIEVHSVLGPGLFESAYTRCLCYELAQRRLHFEQDVTLPLVYKELRVNRAFEVDVIVEGCVVLEVKAVEQIVPIHSQQLYTYLRLSGSCVGLILNFGAKRMKEGIKRIVHKFPLE